MGDINNLKPHLKRQQRNPEAIGGEWKLRHNQMDGHTFLEIIMTSFLILTRIIQIIHVKT